MIEIDLDHRLGDFTLAINLALPARGIIGLIGRSGSGKSTLFSCLAGHLQPERGRITLNHRTLFCSHSNTHLAPAARHIGVVFQEGLLFPHMSVARNLAYGAQGRGTPLWREVVDTLELGPLLAARPGRLSGGERQRVAIGRALLAEPELLLLDEPVSALDPGLKARTLDLIARVHARTGVPMILISHSPEEVRRLCDTVVTLHAGRIVSVAGDGTPAAARPRLAPAEALQCAS
ncbi:MAG: ATP-binding cassette domain-containing protein [Pseudomonadota bacterium]